MFRRKARAFFFFTKKWYFLILILYPKCLHQHEKSRRFSHNPKATGLMTLKRLHDDFFVCQVPRCEMCRAVSINQNEADHRIDVGKWWMWKKSTSEMIYSLRQRSHTLQRVLSTKGKRRGKATKLTWHWYCVRICVCKEYDYNIIPVFEEFTD